MKPVNIETKSDIIYVCGLIEQVGRLTKNQNRDIVKLMGEEGIRWHLNQAALSHCLSLDEVAEELISEYHIPMGNFDRTNRVESVPPPMHVARTYKSLIVNIAEATGQLLPQIIYDVFTSFISDEISDFTTSTFYENPSFIYHSYLEGHLLND